MDVRALLTRRRLLKLGLGAGVVVVVGAVGGGLGWDVLKAEGAGPGLKVLSDRERRVVEAVADAYFPPGNDLGVAAADLDHVPVVDAYVAGLYAREQRGMRALLRGLDRWPQLSFGGGAFSSLPLSGRVDVLNAFDASSITERRLLGTLIRTVCCMGVFEAPTMLAAIGHRHGCGLPIYVDADSGIGG